MVCNEWMNLPASVKQSWRDRAMKLNEECEGARRKLGDVMNYHSPGYYFKFPNKLTEDEDFMYGNPPLVNSDIATNSSPAPSVYSTSLSSKALKSKDTDRSKPKKSLTGYLLYSSKMRMGVCQSNPDASFGDISRMVGNEWKNLPASVKKIWENRARKLNEEPAAPLIYECLWDKCDYQFEDSADCIEHCIQETTGHIQRTFNQNRGTEIAKYKCLWRGCKHNKMTNMRAFSSLLRLVKHVREVHLTKGGKAISQSERSKNFVPRKQAKLMTLPCSLPAVQVKDPIAGVVDKNHIDKSYDNLPAAKPNIPTNSSPIYQVNTAIAGVVHKTDENLPAVNTDIATNSSPIPLSSKVQKCMDAGRSKPKKRATGYIIYSRKIRKHK